MCEETVLHVAAKTNRIDQVKLLLQHNADIAARDLTDDQPIHKAASEGYLKYVDNKLVPVLLESATIA